MYPSDLTDEQWGLIEPLTRRPDPRGARRTYSMREVINAILYLTRTGCQWRMLPGDFPPCGAVYWNFDAMTKRGTWAEICRELNGLKRKKKAGPGSRATCSSTPRA